MQDVDQAPALTIKWLDHLETFEEDQGPITVGRVENTGAQIRIPDNRISRKHITVAARGGQWVARAMGRNGVFIGNERVDDVFVVDRDTEVDMMLGHPLSGIPMSFSTRDPVNVLVGEQIARRRKELGISQRTLADNGVVNAGALISIEKGRSQPRAKTEHSLEEALQWPHGTIEQMRQHARAGRGRSAPTGVPITPLGPMVGADSDRPTELLRPDRDSESTATVEVTMMTETVGIALDAMRSRIATLPDPSDPQYPAVVESVAQGLARLEALTVTASRTSVQMVRELAEVRRMRRALMLKAAASPHATLGQRLFAARRRAELSAQEAAIAAGVRTEDVQQAEAGAALADQTQIALQRFVAALETNTGTGTTG